MKDEKKRANLSGRGPCLALFVLTFFFEVEGGTKIDDFEGLGNWDGSLHLETGRSMFAGP
jgi:hypothetical protein